MVRELRDGVMKVTAQIELKLGRDAKSNKKSFDKYIKQEKDEGKHGFSPEGNRRPGHT